MRGGRNKFGPMYKRDRARKLQVMRERQLTRPAGSNGGPNSSPGNGSSGGSSGALPSGMYAPLSDVGYSPSGSVYGVKHEIQIPQVSSLTSSPDSSPSPMTSATLGYPGECRFSLPNLRDDNGCCRFFSDDKLLVGMEWAAFRQFIRPTAGNKSGNCYAAN